MAGGQLPTETERGFVLLACLAIGLQASAMPSLSRAVPLLGFLAAGQIVMHLALVLPSHDHHSLLSRAMVAAHTAATIAAAAAIVGAESALTWVARSMERVRQAITLALPVVGVFRLPVPVIWTRTPVSSAGVLDSISRRGPPPYRLHIDPVLA